MDVSPNVSALLEQSTIITLKREGFTGRAALAWVRLSEFGIIAAQTGDFLHIEEKEVFEALQIERRRVSYLLGRFTAKSALAKCLGTEFQKSAVAIASGIFNQPVIQYNSFRPRAVSISHSNRLACSLAFPESHPMAIDVEEADEDRTKIMKTQILPGELNLAESKCVSKDLAATLVWTAKEALSKALRCGMTCPYELLEISDLEVKDDIRVGHFKNFGQYKFMSWHVKNTVVTMVLPRRTTIDFVFPQFI